MQIDTVALKSASLFCFVSDVITPAATATIVSVEQAFTLTTQPSPLLATDVVSISSAVATASNVGITGVRVNATGQLCIKFTNPTAGSLTYPAGAFTVLVARA